MSITAHIFGVSSRSQRSGALGRLWQQMAIATNWPVLVSVAVLCGLGVCSIWADRNAPGEAIEGKKQLLFIGVGLVCLIACQAVNYLKIGRWAWTFYGVAILLIIYTILPFTHAEKVSHALFRVPLRGGAYAWINLGPMALQPAELMKVGFIMVLARYLRFRSNYRTFGGLMAPFALALVPLALIMKQPDLGTALTFIPTLFAMLFVAGAKLRHLFAIVGIGILIAPILWLAGPVKDGGAGLPVLNHFPVMVKKYQRERVMAMFASDAKTDQDNGYQQKLAMTAFGSGGMTGKGLGQIPVGEHVPEGNNVMVFALIGVHFGFFGAAVVLGA
jgi:rod shape determining protein RodA